MRFHLLGCARWRRTISSHDGLASVKWIFQKLILGRKNVKDPCLFLGWSLFRHSNNLPYVMMIEGREIIPYPICNSVLPPLLHDGYKRSHCALFEDRHKDREEYRNIEREEKRRRGKRVAIELSVQWGRIYFCYDFILINMCMCMCMCVCINIYDTCFYWYGSFLIITNYVYHHNLFNFDNTFVNPLVNIY